MHELTFSTHRRVRIFEPSRCCQAFVDALRDAQGRHGFRVLGYVVMPEHVHLLVMPPPGVTVALVLKSVKLSSSRALAKILAEESPGKLHWLEVPRPQGGVEQRIWQRGGGYDRNLWSPQIIRASIQYIHMNPVRRGLCASPELWPWSSARAYAQPSEGDWVTLFEF